MLELSGYFLTGENKMENVELNDYGNLISVPKGWVETEKNLRTALLKQAHEENKAFSLVVGWKGSSQYPKPILKWYHHPSVILEKKKAKSKNKSRVEAAKKAAITRKNNIEAAKKRESESLKMRKEKESNFISMKLREELRNIVTIENFETVSVLYENLRDINESSYEWLNDAVCAYEYSYNNNGIMYLYYTGEVELTFYESLCRAIQAYRRHAITNYDELLKEMKYSSIPNEERRIVAREIMEAI